MILEDKKIAYIHIPKTGGTSIARALGAKSDRCKYKHATIKGVKRVVGDDFDDYFKFTFVRNPWDRIASWYMFGIHKGYRRIKRLSFEEWVKRKHAFSVSKREEDYLLIDGELGVDDVGIFEKGLESEFVRMLGDRISMDGAFPHRFENVKKTDYSSMYNQELIDVVADQHKWAIDTFKYDYNG